MKFVFIFYIIVYCDFNFFLVFACILFGWFRLMRNKVLLILILFEIMKEFKSWFWQPLLNLEKAFETAKMRSIFCWRQYNVLIIYIFYFEFLLIIRWSTALFKFYSYTISIYNLIIFAIKNKSWYLNLFNIVVSWIFSMIIFHIFLIVYFPVYLLFKINNSIHCIQKFL